MNQLAELLAATGRAPHEVCTILTQPSGGSGLSVVWTTVAEAPAVAERYSGTHSVWYGVQPLREGVERGRGKAADVTHLVCVYVDLDYVSETKPKGCTPQQVADIIADLSDLLGSRPVAIVSSGHGVQPYWRVERIEAVVGAVVLLRFRELVIKVAAQHGAVVDTGVFDLARILRVPGPPNMKHEGSPAPTGFVPGPPSARTVTAAELETVLQSYVPGEAKRTRAKGGAGAVARRERADEDRVFTKDEALAYLKTGVLATLSATEQGGGFNDALNAAAFEVAAFVPEILNDDEAEDLIIDALEVQFPGGPDANDWATIRSGFGQQVWRARPPSEAERTDPFLADGRYADLAPRGSMTKGSYVRPADPPKLVNGFVVPPPPAPGAPQRHACDAWGRVPGETLDDLFEAEPLFRHIRQYARSHGKGPIALLFTVLMRVATAVPWQVVLPPLTGGVGSLNQILALCSGSSGGKTTTEEAAKRCVFLSGGLAIDGGVPSTNLSTGQGIPAAYLMWRQPKGEEGAFVRSNHAMMFRVGEVEELESLKSGTGSTVGSVLREAWSAAQLGSQNADPKLRRLVPAQQYRWVMIVGVQDKLGHVLLNPRDNAAGTASRILWVPMGDAFLPTIRPEAPGAPWQWTMPTWRGGDAMDRGVESSLMHEIPVWGPAAQRIIQANDEKLLAEGLGLPVSDEDELNGHLLFCWLKLAATIAIALGHLEVRETDWLYAGQLIDISLATRERVAKTTGEESRKNAVRQGKMEGTKAIVVGDEIEQARTSKVSERVLGILRKVGDGGLNKGSLANRLSASQREHLGEALDGLLSLGLIRFTDIVKNGEQVGSTWFIV